ncbi:MAG: replication/maintenance protein RepL [Anaeroplasma bactoclasticum]|nr:replication/maintenance protein RepL [Anaeroplasma bactoclasticum]
MHELKNPFAVSRIPYGIFDVFANKRKRENVILVYVELYGLRNMPIIALTDSTISKRTGINLRTVKRSMKELEDANLIKRYTNTIKGIDGIKSTRQIKLIKDKINEEKYGLLPLIVQYDTRLKYKGSKLLYSILYAEQQKQIKILTDRHQDITAPFINTTKAKLSNITKYSKRMIKYFLDDLENNDYFSLIYSNDKLGFSCSLTPLDIIDKEIASYLSYLFNVIEQRSKFYRAMSVPWFNLPCNECPFTFSLPCNECPLIPCNECPSNRILNKEGGNKDKENKGQAESMTYIPDPNFESLLIPVSEPNYIDSIPSMDNIPPEKDDYNPYEQIKELNQLDYEQAHPVINLNEINKEAEQKEKNDNPLSEINSIKEELTASKPHKEDNSNFSADSGSGENSSNYTDNKSKVVRSVYPDYDASDKDSILNQVFYLSKIIIKYVDDVSVIAKSNAYFQSNQDALKAILEDGYTLYDLEKIIQHITDKQEPFSIADIIEGVKSGAYDDLLKPDKDTSLHG